MKIKQSETREVMRSQLHAQPYNPKKNTDRQVDGQKKNIRTFGYLGGIVWNERTGHLIDGHRRLKALDQLNKYDGSNDYPVKVEVVDFDEKRSFLQLLLGLKTIVVHSGDRTMPKLKIIGIREKADVVGCLRERVSYNRKRMNIHEFANYR